MRFFLLVLAACGADANICTRAKTKLAECGFPVSALDCTTADRTAVETVALRLSERGCEAAHAGEERDVDPRLCALADWPCPATPVPEITLRATKNPVVLVGGIDGTPAFDWHPDIAQAIAETTQSRVAHVSVLPWATTAERAADLWQSLEALRLRGKLNLVCYAVAGLDCRYLASPNGLFSGDEDAFAQVSDRIASITTIATPHRGTAVASAAARLLEDGGADEILRAILGADNAVEVPDDARILATLDGLTPEALATFNERVTNAPNVRYGAVAGVSHPFGRISDKQEAAVAEHCAGIYLRHPGTTDALNELLLSTALFSHTAQGVEAPSDGMISIDSAKWGKFYGCVPADHYDVIGQIGHTTRDPRTGFDAVRFYPYLISQLAAEGL